MSFLEVKELKSLSNSELLEGIRVLRIKERKLDRKIVEYISEIETRRLFAEIGYPSVLEWLVKDLGYSESSAYRRVMAARALHTVPDVAMKSEGGSLSWGSLAKEQSAIRSEEKRTGERVSNETRALMIEKTKNKTLRETDKLIEAQFPNAVKVQGIQISLSEDQLKDLQRVRELKSHSHFGASLGEIVSVLVRDYLNQNDPLRREVRPREQKQRTTQSSTAAVSPCIDERSKSRKNRVPLSPSTRNFVERRAEGGCEYQSRDGRRCKSKYQTEVDHIVPAALGGTNDIANLRLFCRIHNGLVAEKLLGRDKMRRFQRVDHSS